MDIAGLNTLALSKPYTKSLITRIRTVHNGTRVLLEESLFFPTMSGQPNDLGTLVLDTGEECDLVDIRYEDNLLWHIISRGASVHPGQGLTCHLDWDRRFAFMRAHTAAVLVSGIGCRQWGCLISGCNLTESHVRLDFTCAYRPPSDVSDLLDEANAAIRKGYRVSTEIVAVETLKEYPDLLRSLGSLPATMGEKARIVRIHRDADILEEQCDLGTHVDYLDALGELRAGIRDIAAISDHIAENKGRGHFRIRFHLADMEETT